MALEENLHAGHNAFIQVDVTPVRRVQLGIQVPVAGKQLSVADNPIAATELNAGHLFRVTKREDSWCIVQAAGEREARNLGDVHRSKAAQTHCAAIQAVVVPAYGAQTDTGGCGQVTQRGTALSMKIHVTNMTATFMVSVTGTKLKVVVGAKEVYLALYGIVGQAQIQVACKRGSSSQRKNQHGNTGYFHSFTFLIAVQVLIVGEW